MANAEIEVNEFRETPQIPLLPGKTVKELLDVSNDVKKLLECLESSVKEIHAKDLLPMAVRDLKTAVSLNSSDYPIVNFSKIKKSHRYLSGEGIETIQALESEYPHLYRAVQGTRENSSNTEVWNCFERFLVSMAKILESGLMSLPTSEMIEKRQELAYKREIWHLLRQFMEDCCNYVLGSTSNVNSPKFELATDPGIESQLNEFVSEIQSASIALRNSLQ